MSGIDFQAIFEAVPGLNLVLSPDLLIVGVTDSYLKATMTVREEIVGQSMFTAFPDNPMDWSATGVRNLRASLERVIATCKPDSMPIQKYDIRRRQIEGGGFEERYWKPLNLPVLDNGKLKYIIHNVRDVTDTVLPRRVHSAVLDEELRIASVEAEEVRQSAGVRYVDLPTATAVLVDRVSERTEELEEANRELEAFAYSISHDLRAPLRSLQGFSQAILEDYAGSVDKTGQLYLERIAAAATRMDELIEDLLTYSRLSRAELKLEPVDLEIAVATALSIHENEIRERRAEVRVEGPLPAVFGHFAVISQCLSNLLANALKFTKPGEPPRVRVRAERMGDNVRVLVEDQGIGIALEHQQRIFRVFERLHGAEAYPGTGIGLAIVRKGMERLGGSYGVRSEAGKGSLFWFQLPGSEGWMRRAS